MGPRSPLFTGKQLFWNLPGRHGSPHDGDELWRELSADTHAPAPLCDGSALAAWVSVCSKGGRPWGWRASCTCAAPGVPGGLGSAQPSAWSVRRLARPHTDALLGSRDCGPPGTRLCIPPEREAPHGHPKAPSRKHGRFSAAASRRLLLPSHKDLKVVPSLSPLSLSLYLPLSLSRSLSLPLSLPPSISDGDFADSCQENTPVTSAHQPRDVCRAV